MKFIIQRFRVLFILLIIVGCGKSQSPEDLTKDDAFLNVSKRDLLIGAEGGVIYATFSSNRNVSAVSAKSWCKVEISPNKTTENLKLTIEANNDDKRSAGVLLTSADGLVVEITVTQEKTANNDGGSNEDRFLVKVATYNIRVAASADETSGNGWGVRKVPLVDLIQYYNFDIIGTQEGNDSQLADLKTMMPQYDYVGHPYGGSSGTGHNSAIFYKKANYEVIDKGVFWLSETPDVYSISWDATDTRICYWARFKDKATGKEFYFFNTHFYWQYVTARQNSGPLMVSKIQEIAGDLPVICTGDFNSTPSTSQILSIMTLLSDAYDISETPPKGPLGTSFPGGVFEGTPGGRIDYIFVNKAVRVLSYAVLNDTYGNGRYPSDHLPVTSTVSIQK